MSSVCPFAKIDDWSDSGGVDGEGECGETVDIIGWGKLSKL